MPAAVLEVDRVGDPPTHELTHPCREPLVGVDRADAVHDRRHHLTTDIGDDATQALHLVHVVEAVVDPEAVDAMFGQRADPQVHQRIGSEPELGDAVAAAPCSQSRGGHPRTPQIEAVPRILAVVAHHAFEDRAAGEVDDAVPGLVDVLRYCGEVRDLHPHAPEALLPISQGLVDDLDLSHFSRVPSCRDDIDAGQRGARARATSC